MSDAPINAVSLDCRRAAPESNPYWCATHRREHEPRPHEEFTCEHCGETFTKAWSDERSDAETRANFGDIPEDDKAVICDPCFQEFRVWYRATYGRDLIG